MSNIPVTRCIAEAEQRVGAMQVLCSMLVGQLKGEARKLQEIKSALGPGYPQEDMDPAAPEEISAELLES